VEAQIRENSGKGAARSTRRSGFVPAVVYGHKIDPMLIKLQEHSFRQLLHSSGENVIINMDVGKGEPETVILKELQIDPVTRDIMHADFIRVSLEEKISTHVPMSLVGIAPGIEEGGIQEFLLRELMIECQVGKIPEHIEIDVSSLGIGDQVRVGDVELDEDMVIEDDPATIIVTIATPSVIEVEEEEEEGEEIGEEEEMEPEVIGEKRDEEEEEEEE